MSLLFSSARFTASVSESVNVLSVVTPRRLKFGIGGSGFCSTVGKTGSVGSSIGIPSGEGDGVGTGACGGVVTPGTTGCPGGVWGAVCCVAGAAVGFCGSVPGGRVAGFGVGLATGT